MWPGSMWSWTSHPLRFIYFWQIFFFFFTNFKIYILVYNLKGNAPDQKKKEEKGNANI